MAGADDRVEILDVLGRASFATDGDRASELASLFVDEGVMRLRAGQPDEVWLVGREALTRYQLTTLATRGTREDRQHHSSTVFLSLDRDRAVTRSYFLNTVVIGDGEPVPVASGVFDDTFVRTAEGWRLAERHVRPDTTDRAQRGR